MLLQFSVKNFKSIKDEIQFSLEVSSDKNLPDNMIEENGERVLKSAVLFGANASGKTNFFQAITAAVLAIRNSITNQAGYPVGQMIPYAFSEESKAEPCSFEFVFIHNGTKYVYGFSSTMMKVKEEHLYKYNSSWASTVFQREDEQYYFPQALKSKLSPFKDRNLPNRLFLSTSANWNCPCTVEPMQWFLHLIDTYDTQYERNLGTATSMYAGDTDGSLRSFARGLMKEADMNIPDFRLKTEEQTPDQWFERSKLPSGLKPFVFSGIDPNGKFSSIEYSMKHDVVGEEGENSCFLPLEVESSGTQNLFMFAPFLKRAMDTGSTVLVDEFDSSLHPLLTKHIIELFMNPRINKKNAQLIVSTHSTELLNLSLFRRDQLYFFDKDDRTAVSSLYSLDQFAIRPSFTRLREAYLDGRFFAVPKIGNGEALI